MLNVEEYISSGIIESYVMGIAGEEDVQQFERLLPLYPRLRMAMHSFETELERNAMVNAIPPPSNTWGAIQKRIEKERFGQTDNKSNGRGNGETIIPIVSNNQIRVHKYWRYAFITVFILSKIFLYFAVYYYLLYKDASKQLQRLEQRSYQTSPR